MGPSVGCDWSRHHVDPASRTHITFALLLILALPATYILAALLRPGRYTSSEEEALEGVVLQAASVVYWPQLPGLLHLWVHGWEECYEMDVGCQSPWGGSLASGGTSWDWGVFLGGIPHV